MCRNFVAKNNFNRAAVHKTAKDYRRIQFKAHTVEDLDEEPPIAYLL